MIYNKFKVRCKPIKHMMTIERDQSKKKTDKFAAQFSQWINCFRNIECFYQMRILDKNGTKLVCNTRKNISRIQDRLAHTMDSFQ